MKCDCCGRELKPAQHGDGSGITFNSVNYAVSISISDGVPLDELDGYKQNKTYNVCYPCWLRSMGVKP